MSNAPPAPGALPHAHHFPDYATQVRAARLGMWLFLATEVLLFAGLFASYAIYRFLYPDAWQACSAHLDVVMGTVNTVVLLFSSLTVALSVHAAREGKNKMVVFWIVLSLLCGLGFLGIKAVEYSHKFHDGALPGRFYTMEAVQVPGASMFFSVYFLSTGLHAIHVVIGMGILVWVGIMAAKNRFTAQQNTGVELGGMYWHLVDLVWIFLYPLLYLV